MGIVTIAAASAIFANMQYCHVMEGMEKCASLWMGCGQVWLACLSRFLMCHFIFTSVWIQGTRTQQRSKNLTYHVYLGPSHKGALLNLYTFVGLVLVVLVLVVKILQVGKQFVDWLLSELTLSWLIGCMGAATTCLQKSRMPPAGLVYLYVMIHCYSLLFSSAIYQIDTYLVKATTYCWKSLPFY